MRRLTAWLGGAAGGIAAYRLLRRRPQAAPELAPPESEETDGRADELRAKLDESRAAEPAAEEPRPAAAEPEEAESPEARRSRVHDEGRAALDEMKPE